MKAKRGEKRREEKRKDKMGDGGMFNPPLPRGPKSESKKTRNETRHNGTEDERALPTDRVFKPTSRQRRYRAHRALCSVPDRAPRSGTRPRTRP